ncbi:MAG: hypothetical protein E7586_05130 [Ruminococcaceae bacterium]|nr:hypothetical protein [Oscillospiraceae bacterium]
MFNSEEAKLFSVRAAQGLCSHAYIVDGEEGIGKLDFALYCARTLLCTEKSKPCSYCESCRKALDNNHPDIFVIGRDKTASIADVREIIRRSGLKPNDGEKQIFIVCNAGKLRADSQNALLKIFEEPPESVAMFLLTESRSSLLPTVLSRGQRVHLDGMTDRELEETILNQYPNLDSATLKQVSEMSGGNLSKAKKLLSKETAATREKAEKLLFHVLSKNSYEVCAILAAPKHKREALQALLTELAALVAEAQKQKYYVKSVYLPVGGECAEKLKSAGKRALASIGEIALNGLASIDNNANLTALSSQLAIDFLRAAAK